ncbi:MAG TPA: class I SAM-dependent methyltransferase, partial [Anaerolineales bacterium]|nr:class I SAM-dependent methyltransferase [Anaerolineales bacterium]
QSFHLGDEFDLENVFEVEDYLYFYQDNLVGDIVEHQVKALQTYLHLDHPMKILDLACGFGRHANRLAALGHSVVGIDYTPGFLELAKKAADTAGVRVEYIQGDMRTIKYKNEFDCALLLFTSFGYFSEESNSQVVKNLAAALRPGGLLCMDIPNRDLRASDMPPCTVIEKEGNLMIDRHSFDPLTGRWHNKRIIIRDGIRKDKPFSIRLYNLSEIQNLLANSGLRLTSTYADWNGNSLTAEARRMIVIAQKP